MGMMVVLGAAANSSAANSSAASSFSAPVAATISGTVRDINGAPQMGAMIELLDGDASSVATAFSDARGRYILPAILPGHYELRATAAFFVPIFRSNVRLQAGAQAILNLTMSTMFEAENWLPAERRRADEPVDDWKWTLRSTANRPLLRLAGDDDAAVSSSAEQTRRLVSQGRVTVTSGDGTFGDGGMHQAVVLNRTLEDGDGAVLRADVGDAQNAYEPAPSIALSAGYERRSPLGGSTRLLSSFQSHPELTDGNVAGFQVLQLASTQQIVLGDAVRIDVGTLVAAERLEATRIESEPYLNVTVRPGSDVVVEYRYASGREVQSADDLDRLKPMLAVLSDANGRPLSDRGSHNELSVSRKLGDSTVVSFAGFADSFSHGAIAGGGEIERSTMQSTLRPMAVIADPTTGTFEVATAGYSGRGMSAGVMQSLTPTLSAWVEYDLGTALRGSGEMASVSDLAAGVKPEMSQAASVAIRGRILRTGTSLKAEYRWQPARTLTQVNAYNVSPDEAYLSFYVRQRLWCGRLLPQGMDAVVEATNLLEQGYQPVLAADGTTLFLAQVPRAIQGGLAFNF
jgi:hypothetical protein